MTMEQQLGSISEQNSNSVPQMTPNTTTQMSQIKMISTSHQSQPIAIPTSSPVSSPSTADWNRVTSISSSNGYVYGMGFGRATTITKGHSAMDSLTERAEMDVFNNSLGVPVNIPNVIRMPSNEGVDDGGGTEIDEKDDEEHHNDDNDVVYSVTTKGGDDEDGNVEADEFVIQGDDEIDIVMTPN